MAPPYSRRYKESCEVAQTKIFAAETSTNLAQTINVVEFGFVDVAGQVVSVAPPYCFRYIRRTKVAQTKTFAAQTGTNVAQTNGV